MRQVANEINTPVDEDFANIYSGLASEWQKAKTIQAIQKASTRRVSYQMSSIEAKFILKNGYQVSIGEYKVKANPVLNGKRVHLAGLWKMEAGNDGKMMIVRNRSENTQALKLGDKLHALTPVADLYGQEFGQGAVLDVQDLYDDICEALCGETGAVHVFNAEDVMASCAATNENGEGVMSPIGAKKTAAVVVPLKFQKMIASKTGQNNADLDMQFWLDFKSKAGSQLNNYDMMQQYVDTLFATKTGGINKKAVDQKAKNYWEELYSETDPDYGKELVAGKGIGRKIQAIKNEFEYRMSRAPSKNALVHYKNTIALLARKFAESPEDIKAIADDKYDTGIESADDDDMFTDNTAQV